MTDATNIPAPYTAALVLNDGSIFFGYGFGANGQATGEVCFNTAMTGYQEVLTDPSYFGQIITFTFPHIGNVGTNPQDKESKVMGASGLIVREAVTNPSNFRSNLHFTRWLSEKGITGISGIDTRALTRHIRLHGASNVTICYPEAGDALDLGAVKDKLKTLPTLAGMELSAQVTTPQSYEWTQTRWSLESGYGEVGNAEFHVVAVDYGEKFNILRSLASRGCKITVVPAHATADDILALDPDGVFLSNGPGDPAATAKYAVPTIQALIKSNVPVFGICLGHQLLALSLGAKTEKMHQGHRGANHPIKRLCDGAVEITSQNHGFVVSHGSLPKNVDVTHVSLFDGTIAGLAIQGKPVFSVQYHPEASPGPHDSLYLFDQFVESMRSNAQTV